MTPEQEQRLQKLRRIKELRGSLSGAPSEAHAPGKPGVSTGTGPVASEANKKARSYDKEAAGSAPPAPTAEAVPDESFGSIKAGLAGAVQGATMGYTPQIAGGLKSFLTGSKYVDDRDAIAGKFNQLQEQNPVSYTAGSIAGGFAPGLGVVSKLGSAAKAAPGFINAAKAAGAAMAPGAVQGFVSNPGDVAGEVDPLQLGDRATNAGLGAFLGGAFKGAGQLAGKASQVSNDIGLIKSGGASRVAKSAIDDALQSINKTQLAPRSEQVRGLIQDVPMQVNPDRIASTLPGYAKSLAKRAMPDESGTMRTEIPGQRALRLRQLLDASAGYGKSKPFDPSAVAQGEEAKAAADILRRQINEVPGVAPLNQQSSEIIALRDALANSSKTAPIASIRGAPGTDKDSLVKSIDKLAGSNLEGLDSRIGTAKDLLLKPSNLVKPLEFANEVRKMGARTGIGAAATANKAPAGTKEALLQAILEMQAKDGQ